MLDGASRGMLAGAGGVAVMTMAEKIEQRITDRPDSYMPAHVIERLLGLERKSDNERRGLNLRVHFGQAILLGGMAGADGGRWAEGPRASAVFTVIRLANDQTLENVTGLGARPWTWPKDELVIDVLHKAIYAFTTGAIADRLATDPPWEESRRL
jgi:hypothetical protein